MYMNLKPNQHKRISFNTTTMTSLGFIGPPKNLVPPNYFGLKFLGPPRKLGTGGGFCYHDPPKFKSAFIKSFLVVF